MNPVPRKEIENLVEKVVRLTMSGNHEEAVQVLKPVLDTKCPFTTLDTIGKRIGENGKSSDKFFKTFDRIIDYNAMGGFVIAGQGLIQFLPCHFEEVMEKSRDYIVKGDAWYVCDIIGERSLGQALVDCFLETVPWLQTFLEDENRWVKRSVGVAIHFFSKRVVNQPEKTRILLNVLEPHLEEKQSDVVKGMGWGLKTIGKHHPDLLVEYLGKAGSQKVMSKVLIRKALTYLDEDRKAHVKALLNVR